MFWRKVFYFLFQLFPLKGPCRRSLNKVCSCFPMKNVHANSENSIKPFLWRGKCGKCFTECLSKPCGQLVESLPFLSSFFPFPPGGISCQRFAPNGGSKPQPPPPPPPPPANLMPVRKTVAFPDFSSPFFGGEKGRRGRKSPFGWRHFQGRFCSILSGGKRRVLSTFLKEENYANSERSIKTFFGEKNGGKDTAVL